jgi:hypothetical protein
VAGLEVTARCLVFVCQGEEGGRGGRSGYPISSGRVIRVLRNSGNENHYPISAPEKHYPQIWVPAKIGFGFGLPNLPEIYNQSILSNTHNFA